MGEGSHCSTMNLCGGGTYARRADSRRAENPSLHGQLDTCIYVPPGTETYPPFDCPELGMRIGEDAIQSINRPSIANQSRTYGYLDLA